MAIVGSIYICIFFYDNGNINKNVCEKEKKRNTNELMKKGERQDKTQRLVMVLINMPEIKLLFLMYKDIFSWNIRESFKIYTLEHTYVHTTI